MKTKEEAAAYQKNYYQQNKEKILEQTKERRARNPQPYNSEYSKNYYLKNSERLTVQRTKRYEEVERKKKTGWSKEQFDQAWIEQSGCCAICNIEMQAKGITNQSVAADHCHTTGKPRALLCQKCNRKLGVYENNRAFFTNDAPAYLEKHGEPTSLFQRLRRIG